MVFRYVGTKFGPIYAFLVILGQIWAFLAHFIPCPTKKQGAKVFFLLCGYQKRGGGRVKAKMGLCRGGEVWRIMSHFFTLPLLGMFSLDFRSRGSGIKYHRQWKIYLFGSVNIQGFSISEATATIVRFHHHNQQQLLSTRSQVKPIVRMSMTFINNVETLMCRMMMLMMWMIWMIWVSIA